MITVRGSAADSEEDTMRTQAALLREVPGKWSVEEVELDAPRSGEVLVEMVATGLCHSDDHIAQGDICLLYTSPSPRDS